MTILAYDELSNRIPSIFKAGTYVESSFRPFSYELRIAQDDCLIKGNYYEPGRVACAEKGLIELPPGQLAFLSTIEVFNLPMDLLGRFGLKFRFVRLGLVPLLTTFIEPGSSGRLYFPVFNASADTIILRPGEEILSVIFHQVPRPQKKRSINHTPPKWDSLPTDIIDEHKKIHMMSTVELERQFSNLRQEFEHIRNGQERVIALAVTVVTATILGAVLQTMFGLFSVTKDLTSTNTPTDALWILIPSSVYCSSVIFISILVGIILTYRKKGGS